MTSKRSLLPIFLCAAAIFLAYMIISPIVERSYAKPDTRMIVPLADKMTLPQQIQIGSMKLLMLLCVTFAGGSIGSFLNVVACSVPRGEPIAIRSSACPICGSRIRLYDNLPIVSYWILRGKCRDCGVPIPIRYFLVEVIAAAIFSGLFLIQLLPGATNIPGVENPLYTGIVWIVMYAKWDLIGLFVYHAILFAIILTLALIELDHLRPPRLFVPGLLFVVSGFAVAFNALQPVTLADHLLALSVLTDPLISWPWLQRLVTSLTGMVFGFAIGRLLSLRSIDHAVYWSGLSSGFALLGAALGWQATLTIAVMYVVANVLASLLGKLRQVAQAGSIPYNPTFLLLAVALLHHPFWKWIFERWPV